jgi:hypothetical protein
MNRFLNLLTAIVAGALVVCAQTTSDRKPPVLEGGVESVGGQFRVSLTNTDVSREFRGSAQVSIGAPDRQSEVARFEFTLAPQESRVFPLDAPGASGDHYTLTIHERAGALVLLKGAPIKRGSDLEPAVIAITAPAPTDPAPITPVVTAPAVANGLTVKARLAAGRPNQTPGAEIKTPTGFQPPQPKGNGANIVVVGPPVASPDSQGSEQPGEAQAPMIKKPSAKIARRGKIDETRPLPGNQPSLPAAGETEIPILEEPAFVALAFDITTPAPIINASLSVNSNGFKERQTITIHGAGTAEFKLPEDFNESKINYILADASGKTLITGELDLEALKMEDSVRVSEVKFDQTSYSPGQSAHLVMTLEGRSSSGYLLQVTAKDENGSLLLDDSRRGIYQKGKSIQEFHVEIPAEAQGIVAVEFKALGNLTKKLFDSGSRNIVINNTDNDNVVDRGLKIENRRLRIKD